MGGETAAVSAIDARVDVVAFGRPATDALAARIAAAQTSHPLDPVTVVVPSNMAGLSARRLIARRAGGLANVNFVTPFRLAEVLGAAALGPRTPLTNPVLAAAVRAVLRDAPGLFAPVAGHQATHAAVIALYGELSRARPATLDAIAAETRRGGECVRIVRAVRARLTDFYDEDDLARAALARVESDPRAVADLGSVVWHLPERVSPAMADLLAALLAAPTAGAVVALTGDPAADVPTVAACAAAGLDVGPGAVGAAPPTAQRIVSASDPDEEVRAVVRAIAELAETGTALDRIAVFHPAPDPYARTLFEQLAGAGIPCNGPGNRRLADTAAGRTLLGALALPRTDFGRADVLALVSGAPVREADGDRYAATARWEQVSRAAGVVGGLDDWRAKLPALAARLRDTATRQRGDGHTFRAEASERDADAADALLAFVEAVAAKAIAVTDAPTWKDKADQGHALLATLLGPENLRTRWTDAEVAAASRVGDTVARLGALDGIEPAPGPDAFVLALAAELDQPAGRVGRFGEGVLVAPLRASTGLDFDAVFVIGVAEGACPTLRRDDALLPDTDRTLPGTGGELLTRADDLVAQRRAYLVALAAAPDAARTITFPRGELRSRRQRLASRWLLESAAALHPSKDRVYSSELADVPDGVITTVESYAAGVAVAATHGCVEDLDVAALLAHRAAHNDPAEHPVVARSTALARGFECAHARQSDEFTEWDGNLAGAVDAAGTPATLSPSRLEKWAACPFSYFLAHVLWLGERDDPERIKEIGAADRGSLVHEVLERFVQEAIDRGPPAPTEAWTDADGARIDAIAAEVFAAYEAKGRTGRPLTWRRTQAEVIGDLHHFLDADSRYRAAQGVTPAEVEMRFGLDGEPPATITVGERTLSFRGKVDRVDRGDDGRVFVLDYKTGKGRKYEKLADDPVQEGTTLQLGIYAEAALARHPDASAAVTNYWMATTEGGFAFRGYEWDADVRDRFLGVTGAILDGVGDGVFPARSGEYESFFAVHQNCRYCDFDRVCARDREDHEQAKAAAPELAVLARLAVPEPEADDDRGAGGDG